ncbi:MAG: FtsW/RodA/SpoVE family cell cycle protein [Bacilli bacterium]|jgi:rod shape determining protein RodA|nr:FtsW/RodA/SpoVE family cell cycle protein [Bacilli bacterium]
MKKKKLIDNVLIFVPIIVLLVISLLNMYKVGIIHSMYKNYFLKQTIWFTLGFIIMGIVILIKPKLLFKYSKYFYLGNIFLLILVLFVGKTINGSRAWFSFGFISFQPSELMKYTLLLYLCEVLSKHKAKNSKEELIFLLKAFFITLIPSLFVFLEPDTGAIIIYFIIMLGIILVFRINKKWYIIFGICILLFLTLFGYLYYFNKDLLIKILGTSFFYRVDRILTFVNKDSFQLDRALISIGTSGILSSGNHVYIPEAPTDFIIALTISNFGIISFIFIILALLILDIFFLYKLFKNNNLKYRMFLAGFLMMFIFAQVQNIGMNLGILPIIGLPMPFLSYGGTNIIVYFIFLGTLLGIIKKN